MYPTSRRKKAIRKRIFSLNNAALQQDKVKEKLSTKIRNIFLAGIAVFIPVMVTLFILRVLVSWSDSLLYLLPKIINPQTYLPVPGLSLVIAVVLIFIIGAMTYNYMGQKMLSLMEHVFSNIPFIKSVYNGARQITDAFTENKRQFNHVVLVEFPRPESYAIGFVVGKAEIGNMAETEHITIFVPTVPNPTSGFFLFVRKSSLLELNISIEDAFKIILTMGLSGRKDIKALPFQSL